MMSYEPGDVLLIPFPFSDLSGTKKRPALVLAVSEDNQELICMMLTSVSRENVLDYPVKTYDCENPPCFYNDFFGSD